jgi:hypothetical protein
MPVSSVGQQAYVGLGAYAFFYLTGALNVNVTSRWRSPVRLPSVLVSLPFSCAAHTSPSEPGFEFRALGQSDRRVARVPPLAHTAIVIRRIVPAIPSCT